MRYFQTLCFAAVLAFCGNAMAGDSLHSGPHLGLYVSKHFGSQQEVPMAYGLQLNYRTRSSFFAPQADLNARPAIFDLRFSGNQLQDFRASGVSVLEPTYMLGANDEGFFSSINWVMVGFVALGAGIFVAADDSNEDREERIAEIERNNQFTGSDDSDSGDSGADGGDSGDGGGLL